MLSVKQMVTAQSICGLSVESFYIVCLLFLLISDYMDCLGVACLWTTIGHGYLIQVWWSGGGCKLRPSRRFISTDSHGFEHVA